VQLRMQAIHEHRPLPDEGRAMANQRCPLALGRRRDVHRGNTAGEPHAGEQFRVDVITLVRRLGDRAEPSGMREHEGEVGAAQHLAEPRPGGTGLHHDLEWAIRREQRQQSLAVLDPHARGLHEQLSGPVHHTHDDIPGVSIQSSDKHVGLLVGMAHLWLLGRFQNTPTRLVRPTLYRIRLAVSASRCKT